VRGVRLHLDECVLRLQVEDVAVGRLLHLHLADAVLRGGRGQGSGVNTERVEEVNDEGLSTGALITRAPVDPLTSAGSGAVPCAGWPGSRPGAPRRSAGAWGPAARGAPPPPASSSWWGRPGGGGAPTGNAQGDRLQPDVDRARAG
jgi:hypothetical protein